MMENQKKLLERVKFFKTLSVQHRINILYALYEGNKTFTDLMFDCRINPKSLRDHLAFLFKNEFTKKEEIGYSLTDKGKDLCELKFLLDSH